MTPRFIGRRRIVQKLTWGLHPVFKQLGVVWNPPKTCRFDEQPPIATFIVSANLLVIVGVLGFLLFLIPQWFLADRN